MINRTGRKVALTVLVLVSAEVLHSQQLYWVQATYAEPKVRTMMADGTGLTTAALAPGSLPHGIAFDGKLSRLYWTSGRYERAHLFSATQTFSVIDTLPQSGEESSFQGVAVDTTNGKVYWTTSHIAQGCSIRRANLDGTGEDSLVNYPANGPENLRGIALDLLHGMMYWADFGTGVIRRSTLDGANPQDFVTGLAGPVGIALDVAGGKIYWCEANAHAIRCTSLEGASVTTLVSGLSSPQYLTVDPKDSLMFWTELTGNGHGKIKRANLNGSAPVTLLGDQPADSVSYPSGIAFRAAAATSAVPETAAPLTFSLDQNYPNPFNPTTTIQVIIGGVVAPSGSEGPISGQWTVNSKVSLAVYDVLGREVAVLASGTYPAGKYSFTFDGSKLASGMYFVRLTAGEFAATRSMILLK